MKKLKYENNWEADSYLVGKDKVSELTLIVLKTDLGDNKEYEVTSRNVSIPYDDMGHTYYGDSKHYFIKIPIGITDVEIDLNKIITKQSVYAVKYTLVRDS